MTNAYFSRINDEQTRAKLRGFAPENWDPRKVVQNSKLPPPANLLAHPIPHEPFPVR
jgi:hypothetical protein